MSGEDGYTLVEMLAALAILGLAMTGLAESMNAIRLTQGAAARAIGGDQTLARAGRGLSRVLDGQGPFRSGDGARGLTGQATAFGYVCGKARCGARLTAAGTGALLVLSGPNGWSDTAPLPGVRTARFVYDDGPERLDVWPPAPDHSGVLRSVTILADDAPVASTRLWIQQAAACAFDSITADCRGTAP